MGLKPRRPDRFSHRTAEGGRVFAELERSTHDSTWSARLYLELGPGAIQAHRLLCRGVTKPEAVASARRAVDPDRAERVMAQVRARQVGHG